MNNGEVPFDADSEKRQRRHGCEDKRCNDESNFELTSRPPQRFVNGAQGEQRVRDERDCEIDRRQDHDQEGRQLCAQFLRLPKDEENQGVQTGPGEGENDIHDENCDAVGDVGARW